MAVSLLEVRRQILLNTPHIESVSGSIATFNTDLSADLTDMKIHFLPVQEGAGDPSPDNVRPITGWDGVTVTRCGKNWIDQNFLRNASNYKNGGLYGYYYTDWIYLPPNTQYKFTWYNDTDILGGNLYVANANQYIVNNGLHRQYSAFTTNSEGAIRFGLNKGSSYSTMQDCLDDIFDNGNLQLELGSTATDYEPYTSLEIPISFPQTIYGGYVDLIRGELVEEWKSEPLSNFTWSLYNSGTTLSRWRTSDIPVKPHALKSDVYHGLCDKLRSISYNGNWNITYRLSPSSDGVSWTYAILPAMTTEEFEEFISTVTLCYELETPIVAPLTPQTIKALKGINNIWSDANGDVEVKFWTH